MNKAPTFQHRHYKAIAAAMVSSGFSARATVAIDASALADVFEADNPRFDRKRFLAAANGKPSNGRDNVRS